MYPLEVRKVMAALGGARTVGGKPETLAELADVVARGLPSAVVSKLAANAAPDDPAARRRVAALVTSPSSLKRRRLLSPEASERAERLARTLALAQEAFGDPAEARTWLNTPHPLLGSSRPIDVAATELGARQIERLLHNIEHDLPV
ncbi:MAG TPA: antitoxin Xre/MbcA/ParS toxin-binding domain-containing protein [Acetobacteraceae bacterium]|nr:antitoxin Xre/MbcA/ParS toxin-binding domain-containing protein [Acetobacteraceae bacterium]